MSETGEPREIRNFGPELDFVKPDNDVLIVKLFGTWRIGSQVPGLTGLPRNWKKTHL